jgi:predicted ATPase
LLTLTGTGGCGKTRLALELAVDLLSSFKDGVWLVELAPLVDSTLVPRAAMAALGLHVQPGESASRALAGWIGRRQMLLVFDNCEHLIDACAECAEILLDACPNLRLLATSREPLRITAEATWQVPSLAAPDPRASDAELLRAPAVQLFNARAQAARADFPALERVRTVGRICLGWTACRWRSSWLPPVCGPLPWRRC